MIFLNSTTEKENIYLKEKIKKMQSCICYLREQIEKLESKDVSN